MKDKRSRLDQERLLILRHKGSNGHEVLPRPKAEERTKGRKERHSNARAKEDGIQTNDESRINEEKEKEAGKSSSFILIDISRII